MIKLWEMKYLKNTKQNTKSNSFIRGALILGIANLLVKVIGAVFKIPLINLIGDDGMGYFNVAYQIYTFMFIIATAGFPIAISKMVAESVAKEHTTMAMYFNSTKDTVKGHRNRSSPVTLFITVCKDINCFLETYPHMILLILITAIRPPHIHSHCGI